MLGLRADDATGRLDPVEHGHADVHQHDVGPQSARRGDGVLAVAASPTTVVSGSVVEDLAQADPDQRLVVGDQNGRHLIGSNDADAKPPLGRRPASRRPP